MISLEEHIHGKFDEFILAEILQLFALSEKTGSVTVTRGSDVFQLFIEAVVVQGWDAPRFNLQETLLSCGLLPNSTLAAIDSVSVSDENAGLSLIFSNLLEPVRWDGFVLWLLERKVYPVLHDDNGSYTASTTSLNPPKVCFRIPVQQLVHESSRWESEIREMYLAGYGVDSAWDLEPGKIDVSSQELSSIERLT